MIAGMRNSVISYSYDAQGRVTERHRSGGVFGEQVTITTYNDHGDKASERETMVMRSDTGPWNLTESGAFVPTGKPNPPQPPSSSETQYTYQYDQYGNWTEQTLSAALNRTKHFDPRMSFVVSWVTTNVCRCSAWRFPARLPINRHYAHCGQAPSQWSYRARSWPFGFAEEGLRREWVIASP